MAITKKGLIKFGIIFAVIVTAFLVVFYYIGIEINDRMLLAILGLSLLSAMIISLHRKGVFHEGHFPITSGVVFLLVGVGMFWGTLSYSYYDDDGNLQRHEKLWDLSSQEAGMFLLLIAFGGYSIYGGLSQMFQASYSWGMKRR